MAVFHKLKQNAFFGHVLLLMASTGIAQAIPIAMMPILTRLYTPADFGTLALFAGVASVISVIATARYELAIMLPKKDEDAGNLAVLSILVASVISLVTLAVVVIFNEEICAWLGNREIGRWLYLVPTTVFLTGVYQTLSWWSNRKKQFKRLAFSRISQSGGAAGTQLAIGLNVNGPGGLIFGTVLGQVVATFVLFKQVWSSDRLVFKSVNSIEIKRNAKVYANFPKYSMFGALVDSAALQMPIFILNKFFSAQVTGMFSFTFRALNLPMSLVTSALSQVLFQRIVSVQHEDPARVRPYILKIAGLLSLLMIPFVLVVWLFGEPLFAFVFGEAWRQAGSFAALLAIAVAIRFIVSPLSSVLAMEHNVRMGVLWQVLYFLTITTTLYLSKGLEITQFFQVFVVHEIVLYGLYFVFILKGTNAVGSEV